MAQQQFKDVDDTKVAWNQFVRAHRLRIRHGTGKNEEGRRHPAMYRHTHTHEIEPWIAEEPMRWEKIGKHFCPRKCYLFWDVNCFEIGSEPLLRFWEPIFSFCLILFYSQESNYISVDSRFIRCILQCLSRQTEQFCLDCHHNSLIAEM